MGSLASLARPKFRSTQELTGLMRSPEVLRVVVGEAVLDTLPDSGGHGNPLSGLMYMFITIIQNSNPPRFSKSSSHSRLLSEDAPLAFGVLASTAPSCWRSWGLCFSAISQRDYSSSCWPAWEEHVPRPCVQEETCSSLTWMPRR